VDLRTSAEDAKFAALLRAWLSNAVEEHGPPPRKDDWSQRRGYDTGWQRKLFEAGYGGIAWPREYGGRGASPVQQLIYYEEIARAHAPHLGVNFVGLQHAGPTLFLEGTPEQKARHLPRILSGDDVWCSGFSEPSAGSDLASLKTRAAKDGDEYVVTGQKIWCSYAHVADYCQLLVRTDPNVPKHEGLTSLILPMKLAGVEPRSLRTIEGDSEFCEVFLNEVRVPTSNRIGKENDGWRIANVTLRFERGTSFAGWIYELEELLKELARIAQRVTRRGARASDDVALRRELGELEAEVRALWALVKLSVCQAAETGVPSLGSSAIKLAYSELYQRITDVALRLLGRAVLGRSDLAGFPNEALFTKTMHSLSLTISAGSSQIQRNIISERILGLPKEAR
jgi:alkylation response protein AidB-like acyl-CoA dehydrogenase